MNDDLTRETASALNAMALILFGMAFAFVLEGRLGAVLVCVSLGLVSAFLRRIALKGVHDDDTVV